MNKLKIRPKKRTMKQILGREEYTVKQVAAGLMITFLTVYGWVAGKNAGEPLPCLRYGETQSRIRIRESDLLAWLAKERPSLIPVWKTREGRKVANAKGPLAHEQARIEALVKARVEEELAKRAA